MEQLNFSKVTKLGDFNTSGYVPMVHSNIVNRPESVKIEIESFLLKVAQEHMGN